MKNFEYTNYAINKANSDAIVYRFANGDVKEITVDDFGGDELAFRTWKAFSDNNYHEEDNHTRSVCRKDISLEAVEEVDLGCSESCLDTFIKTEDDDALREGVEELLSILSPQQRKRLLLYVIEGMKKQDIAVVEGCSPAAVGQSISSAMEKIKKYFEKNKKMPLEIASKMAVSERVSYYRAWAESHKSEDDNSDSIMTTE